MSETHGSAGAGLQKLAGRTYYIIFWEPTQADGDRSLLRPRHIDYILSLEADGRLFGAGPFLDENGKSYGRGMFILRAGSAEEAREIAHGDPFYVAGFRTYRIEPWRRGEGSINLRISIGANQVVLD